MEKKETDRLLEKLNQMLKSSNKAISIWTNLMKDNKYPKEDCIKHIDMSNKQKEAILKLIYKYETRR